MDESQMRCRGWCRGCKQEKYGLSGDSGYCGDCNWLINSLLYVLNVIQKIVFGSLKHMKVVQNQGYVVVNVNLRRVIGIDWIFMERSSTCWRETREDRELHT